MKLDPPIVIHDLPIPEDAVRTRMWTGQMLEMAAHIGPYATLLLIDRLGGQTIRVPMDPERNRLKQIIGDEKSAIMSRVYGGQKGLAIPVGVDALNEARRGPILAAIRSGQLTINAAVPILRLKRSTISYLLNHTDEGTKDRPWVDAPKPKRDTRQLDMFDA